LRDGKIQRVEVVSEHKKQESFDRLSEKLNEIQRKKDVANEKKMREQPKFESKPKGFIVRRPNDYKTHPEHIPGSAALTDFTTIEE